MWRKITLWTLRVFLGAVMFCASVGPRDVDSNVSAWLDRFGLRTLADALADQRVDTKALVVSALLLGLTILLPWWSKHFPARPKHIYDVELRDGIGLSSAPSISKYPSPVQAIIRAKQDSNDAVGSAKSHLRNGRDTHLAKGLAFAITGDFEGQLSHAMAFSRRGLRALEQPLVRFREAARNGELRVWGKNAETGLYERIDPAFWEYNAIDPDALISLMPVARTVSVRGEYGGADDIQFYDIMLNRAEVERVWPHAG